MLNKKIKTISFHVTLDGMGGVNWEGANGNKDAFVKAMIDLGLSPNVTNQKVKNIKWHKANYYIRDGKMVHVLKISADCIRHQMAGAKNSAITLIDSVWAEYLASNEALVRGYFFPKEGEITTKRKSPLSVTDAEEVSGVISMIENKSASGVRNDTSFFQQETFGSTVWEFTITLNLSELQFIPASDIYDRRAVPRHLENTMLQKYRDKFGDVKDGYYKMKYASVDIPEYGYMLPQSAVRTLVNWYADTVRNIYILDATSHAKYVKMTVSALDEDNNLVDNFDLNSDYEVCSQYVEGDKAKYEVAKVEVERQLAESNKAAKDAKKKAEKEAKAKAKAKKEAEEQAKKEAEEKAATEESA